MVSKVKIFFLILALGSFIVTPLGALAGEYLVNNGADTVSYNGIVPCGKPVRVNGACCILPCSFCHFFVMLDNIIDFFMFNLVPVIAVLMLVFGGFIFLTSGENPGNIDWAKRIITSTIKGLLAIFTAWLIVNAFFMFIGVADWTGLESGWFQINCGIETQICQTRQDCADVVKQGKIPCSTIHQNDDPVLDSECQ